MRIKNYNYFDVKVKVLNFALEMVANKICRDKLSASKGNGVRVPDSTRCCKFRLW